MSSARFTTPAPPNWLTWGLRAVALLLGALHTTIAVRSQSMNEDGINYLDLGDAWWQGQWDAAVNTTWSPLYAWILGAVVNLAEPSIWWEFPAVQIANFVLYALTLVCFEYFWRQLTRTCYSAVEGEREAARMPLTVWTLVGYSLFIYVSLNLVQLWAVTPDMCVAALVYVAAGRLLALAARESRPADALLLGSTLGLGYLAKAAMFPLGVVAIVLAALLPNGRVSRSARLGLAVATFMLIAVPWAAAVSNSVGHATFSDVGRFTYLKHVNQMPWPHWQEAAGRVNGTPIHAPRRIHDDPPVWEFATPVGGTYPLGYDPAWWTRGLEPRVEAGTQISAFAGNLVYFFDLFLRMQGGFLAITMLLLVLGHRAWRDWLRFDGPAVLVLWSLAAFGLYSIVFAEGRYIAPFVLLFWAGLIAKVRVSRRDGSRRLVAVGGALLALLAWINIGAFNLAGLAGVAGFTPRTESMASGAARGRSLSDGHKVTHPQIAEALQAMGLKAGDQVAFVGYSYSAYWARLARLRIVAEIRPEDAEALRARHEWLRRDVVDAVSAAGAVAVIAEPGSIEVVGDAWRQVGRTEYTLLPIRGE